MATFSYHNNLVLRFRNEDIRRSIESLDCVLAEYEEVPFNVKPGVPFTPGDPFAPAECDEYDDVAVITRPSHIHHEVMPQNDAIYDDNVLCARSGQVSNETSVNAGPSREDNFDGNLYTYN